MSGEPLLSPDSYLALRSSQFKVPLELARKNLRNIQRLNKKHTSTLRVRLKRLQNKKLSKAQKLEAIDKLINLQKSFRKEIARRAKHHNEFVSRLVVRAERLANFEDLVKEARKYQNEKDLEEQLGSSSSLFVDSNNDMTDTSNRNEGVSFKRAKTFKNASPEYCQSLISELAQKGGSKAGKLSRQIKKFLNDEIYLNVIEYLLRTSIHEDASAKMNGNIGLSLAKKFGLTKFIDWDVISQGISIYRRIMKHMDLKILIAWCSENEKKLKELNLQSSKGTDLTYETSFNLFVSKIEHLQLFDALNIASNRLIDHSADFYSDDSLENSPQNKCSSGVKFERFLGPGILYFSTIKGSLSLKQLATNPEGEYTTTAFGKNNDYGVCFGDFQKRQQRIKENIQMYEDQLGEQKWKSLAEFFLTNFNAVYGMESTISLIDLLEVGLPVLKTRYCELYKELSTNHGPLAKYMVSSCPICSSTFGEYSCQCSHQVVSNVFSDPVLTPDRYIFSSAKLYNSTLGLKRAEKSDEKYAHIQPNGDFLAAAEGKFPWSELHFSFPNPLTGTLIEASEIRKVYPA